MLAPKVGQPAGQVSVPALAKRVAADQLIMAPIGVSIYCFPSEKVTILICTASVDVVHKLDGYHGGT
jgi:hypothetical protein